MALTRTLAEIIDDVEFRADLPTTGADTFVTLTQMRVLVNQSLRRFVGLLVRAYGAAYLHKTSTISVVNGTASYALPSDFYQLMYLRVTIDGNRLDIDRAGIDHIDMDPQAEPDWTEVHPRYRLLGSKIHFTPTPRADRTVTIGYVPTLVVTSSLNGEELSEFVVDDDYIDGINGWEEWITLDVAIKCLKKEESDPSLLIQEQQAIEQEIMADAAQRDQGGPAFVRNTYDRGFH